jgi:probable O-glycosylation ligase (exosortase A-associated)
MEQHSGQGWERWAFGLLLAFLGTVYTVPSQWLPWMAQWRPALVTSALAAGLVLLDWVRGRRRLVLGGSGGVLLVTFCALTLASIGWSLDPAASRFTAVELIKWLVAFLTLVNLVKSERRLALACLTLVLASLVTAHGVISFHEEGRDLVDGYRSRWLGTYSDPNMMAMCMGIVVPLALAFLLRRESPWLLRLACGVAGGLALTAMVLSYSRGGFLGLVASGVTWVLLERRASRTAALAVVALGLLVLAPQNFWERTQSVSRFEEDESAMSRVEAWTVTSRVNMDHPLLGVGAGTFLEAWRVYGPPESRRAYAAHNIFLQVISDLGFVGLALFLAFIGGVLGPLVKAARAGERGWLARALAAATVGYLVSCLFAGFLVVVHLYVLLGLGACAERVARASRERELLPTPVLTGPPGLIPAAESAGGRPAGAAPARPPRP